MTDIQEMLVAQEGLRLKPYTDTVGKLSIGVGRNLDDVGIDRDEAMMMLNRDIAHALDDIHHCFSCYDQLSRPRQLVLISLAFQLGRERLSQFVRFIGAVHLGHYDEAAEHLLDSKAAKQTPVRYQQLAAMMRDNVSQWI